MKGPNGKPKVAYMGVVYDQYTPAVEGQLLRDCLVLQSVARNKYNEIVIICEDDSPDRMLAALGITRQGDPNLAKDWIMYRTREDWPEEPENTRTLIQRDLYQPIADSNMVVMEDGHNNGFYLPPQGRLSPDTLSLLRPAPNGYIPIPSALILMWS
jgi:hypothetical protein